MRLETDGTLRQVLLAICIVAIVSFLVGAAFGTLVFAPEEPEPQPDPVGFESESAIHDDRIVHTFTPDSDELLSYQVSYEVLEDGTTLETVEDRTDQLSSDEPLVIEHRNEDAAYEVSVRITDEYDRLVYDARIGVGTPRNA